jgi:NADH-quinone oxidoreductase subunit M
MMLFGFFMLASLGLPGLSGFVGEFLVFLGTFAYWPVASAIATIVVILGAAYLMWMYQRLAFGELSDFLKGLGHHLTDINRTELLTLTPLVALTLLFGLFPGLVLDLVNQPVDLVLQSVASAGQIAVGR